MTAHGLLGNSAPAMELLAHLPILFLPFIEELPKSFPEQYHDDLILHLYPLLRAPCASEHHLFPVLESQESARQVLDVSRVTCHVTAWTPIFGLGP